MNIESNISGIDITAATGIDITAITGDIDVLAVLGDIDMDTFAAGKSIELN